jgi:hypothetical protein
MSFIGSTCTAVPGVDSVHQLHSLDHPPEWRKPQGQGTDLHDVFLTRVDVLAFAKDPGIGTPPAAPRVPGLTPAGLRLRVHTGLSLGSFTHW